MSHFKACADGCDGDKLPEDCMEIVDSYGYNEGWGHHSYSTLYRTSAGKLIAAHCGGCSCSGSGDWSYINSESDFRSGVSEFMLNDENESYKGANDSD